MAPKKGGLGRRLADIEAMKGGLSGSLSIPEQTTPRNDTDFVIIPRGDRLDPIPDNYQYIDDEQYAPYPVERVTPDTDPELYGQGPDKSTRVASHKFVPYGRLMSRAAGGQAAAALGIRYGTVYVKFQNNGNIYRYDSVPDHLYQNFRNSNSKGKFINNFLNNYSYSPAANDAHTRDL
jgi:hypothetical protein